MTKAFIDNQEVHVPEGTTILHAAAKLGIHIPTLCFLEGCTPATSCMVCLVKIKKGNRLAPACATRVEEGMEIECSADDVLAARRTALELLLSDHVGDCMAPCHGICPARMDIPLMLRQIVAGEMRAAIATVKADIALPAVLGRICPAPCEKGCRRAAKDSAVSIMRLKRYVADVDLASGDPYLPPCQPASGKKVAIIGAGPTGLAAAYYLLQDGHQCAIFDEQEHAGGMLRYGVKETHLPHDVLDAEIDVIRRLGAHFRLGVRVGHKPTLAQIREEFDAVVVATGEPRSGATDSLALAPSATGIQINPKTYETSAPGVFAAGDAVRKGRMAVRACADGKSVAFCVHQHLAGKTVTGPTRAFSVHMGQLHECEIDSFMTGANPAPRHDPPDGEGFASPAAVEQSLRCLHCDCRKPDTCKLRQHCAHAGASPSRYKAERRKFEQYAQHARVIYEPGKCILCGLCVQIADRAREELGLTFVGRGFNVRVAVPFDKSIADALTKVADECVRSCPTAALSFKEE